MTDTIDQRTDLVEAITREVLRGSAAWEQPRDGADPCATCLRGCAAQCAAKVREIVAGGRRPRRVPRGRRRRPAGPRPLHRPHAAASPTPRRRRSTSSATRPRSTASRRSASTRPGCAAAPSACAAAASRSARWSASRSARRPPDVKAFEARRAIRDGAREIDMVINIGALKSGGHDLVREDIARSPRPATNRAPSQGDHRGGPPDRRGEGHRLPPRARRPGRTSSRPRPASPRAAPPSTTWRSCARRSGRGWASRRPAGSARPTDVQDMIAAGATRIGASASVKHASRRQRPGGATEGAVLTSGPTSSSTASSRSTPRFSAPSRRASCRWPASVALGRDLPRHRDQPGHRHRREVDAR